MPSARLVADGLAAEEIDEAAIATRLYTRGRARSRPAHPHRRRAAHQQLPDLAGGVRRAVLLRPLLARLRPVEPSTRRWPSTPAEPPLRPLDSTEPHARSALISAAVLVPVVVIVFLLGDPWLTLGIAALAVLAAYGSRPPGSRGRARCHVVPGIASSPRPSRSLARLDSSIRAPRWHRSCSWRCVIASACGRACRPPLRRLAPADGFRSWRARSMLSTCSPSLRASSPLPRHCPGGALGVLSMTAEPGC